MRVLSVVGARPNFMKVAPIITAIQAHNEAMPVNQSYGKLPGAMRIEHVLLHTGQHYDARMSECFFADLCLPRPDLSLGVGSGSHASQTAEIMVKFEQALSDVSPTVLLVVGDVNSTIACALVAAKATLGSAQDRPLIAHVEAGLRSFDREMPEEINRILTDHLSDVLFVTEESGVRNLAREGIAAEKVHFVGNTMIDTVRANEHRADASRILVQLGLCRDGSPEACLPYALLTLHRPANVDDEQAFRNILDGLDETPKECPIIFPVHPRTRRRLEEFASDRSFAARLQSLRLIEPLGYLDFLCLMKRAALVITDSGGIQEESTCLRVPCVTVRENTERPVTVTHGSNVLAGVKAPQIRAAIRQQWGGVRQTSIPEKWDGLAAVRIVEVLCQAVAKRRHSRLNNTPAGVSRNAPPAMLEVLSQ